MSASLGYNQLDELNGELLPERTLLSTVVNMAYGTHVTVPGATIAYACTYHWDSGTQGLLGALGLGHSASLSVSCVPAAIVAH